MQWKKALATVAMLVVSSGQVMADDLSATCSLSSGHQGILRIDVGEVDGNISLENFGKSGSLGVTVTVSGNGNSTNFAGKVRYNAIGNRLELQVNYFTVDGVSLASVQEAFGAFPKVECTIS